jgi:ABC-type phosphate/phosphonate transport system ATPase subunit
MDRWMKFRRRSGDGDAFASGRPRRQTSRNRHHSVTSRGDRPGHAERVVIELMGIGVLRRGADWLLHEVCATLQAGTLVVVGADRADARQAFVDVIAGVRIPVEGRVWIDRVPLMRESTGRVRRMTGDVDPTVLLAECRSLFWNALPSRAGRRTLGRLLLLPRPHERRATTAALAVVGLAERMQKPASGLTAADRVRVLIARALAHAPRHLLIRDLDRALPPDDVQPMLSLLRSFTRGDRRSVIVTLAEPPVAARLADRFLFLSAGRLVHDADCAPARNVGVERNLQLVRT